MTNIRYVPVVVVQKVHRQQKHYRLFRKYGQMDTISIIQTHFWNNFEKRQLRKYRQFIQLENTDNLYNSDFNKLIRAVVQFLQCFNVNVNFFMC